uniref:Uncharacterized protein n=1 Tax=Arundo donax TaxID=35708 RepID=A0A0A9A7R4_ARUDO
MQQNNKNVLLHGTRSQGTS